MDQDTRNKLQRATQQVRRILEEEFAEQLEGRFDVLSDGTIAEQPGAHLDATQRLKRQKLVQAISHIESGGKSTKDAIEEYLRQAAFTILNRFVALRMLEARDLLQECVSKGDESSGFKEFCGLAPGLSALPDGGYRLYLECLCDELTVEIKVLFDRRDPTTLLWPRRSALTAMLDVLAQPELASVWAEDETIGWVYQYFNGDEERTKMRAESQAPRNSRELAVRNQFFTPRYVVQFLTDNTLGRTWYEMMQGDTQLAHLDYLVRRPNEVFLAEGESAPESDTDESELSQEELLQQTVHVPFRAKKDPRELRILDPACGSGHFLLYTFDLLITIYEEAWADTEAAAFTETGTQLRTDYESLEDLRQAMPELILRHNLHGVDIDPRAAQIAALALWMRAQRAYNQFEVDRAQRPPITKTNIVVAEPMPGDAELVDEFAASLKPAVLGDLFKKMVEEMKLAGELGSLLKIEESIAKAVKEARIEYVDFLKQRQNYLPGMNPPSEQKSLDLSEITDDSFYDSADEKIIAALGSFAESAAGAGGVRRQLFAGDAAQGVAFIELMRKRFDAVLMNPPFGSCSKPSKTYIDTKYKLWRYDLYPCFVARGVDLLTPEGANGAITSRTGFFGKRMHSWRKQCLLGEANLTLVADLGHRVLDALVEVAAYVVWKTDYEFLSFFNCLATTGSQKGHELKRAITSPHSAGIRHGLLRRGLLEHTPLNAILYWAPLKLLQIFKNSETLDNEETFVREGLHTSDNERFLRLWWELPPKSISDKKFVGLAKGGDYSPYYSDLHLVLDWRSEGREILASKHGVVPSKQLYFRPGLTYTRRTASAFSVRPLPADSIFTESGCIIWNEDKQLLLAYLALLMTHTCRTCIELMVGSGDAAHSGSAARHFLSGVIGRVPLPKLSDQDLAALSKIGANVSRLSRDGHSNLETDHGFRKPRLLASNPNAEKLSLKEAYRNSLASKKRKMLQILEASSRAENISRIVFDLDADAIAAIEEEFGPITTSYPHVGSVEHDESVWKLTDSELVYETFRVTGGRYATKQSFISSRRIELFSHLLQIHPEELPAVVLHDEEEEKQSAIELVSFLVGEALGRWHDPRNIEQNATTSEWSVFDSLRPPPLLNDVVRNSQDSGDSTQAAVLCDDPGNPQDLTFAVKRRINAYWTERASDVEAELADLLDTKDNSIRSWLGFRFFAAHVSGYSKSRRKAPIYWQLSTPSASYSVWCYYHRLTRDTFFRVANDYVTPKVDHEERKLNTLRQEAGPDPSSKQRKDIDAQETFVAELRAFLTEVKRIAPLWNPNLNDGVIINFAPLWRLVPQHKAWQKECKKVWDKLVKGDYDWAHLAMHLWPERVVPKCQDDRSLAIAHGLEDDFWYEDDNEKWQKREPPEDGWEPVLKKLIDERTSPEVKAALESLLEAPAPAAKSNRRRKQAKTN